MSTTNTERHRSRLALRCYMITSKQSVRYVSATIVLYKDWGMLFWKAIEFIYLTQRTLSEKLNDEKLELRSSKGMVDVWTSDEVSRLRMMRYTVDHMTTNRSRLRNGYLICRMYVANNYFVCTLTDNSWGTREWCIGVGWRRIVRKTNWPIKTWILQLLDR